MSDIQWPDGLRGPLISNFSRDEVVGFVESELTSGPSFVEIISDDNPTFYGVTYQFKEGDARMFASWLRVNEFRVKSPWFDGPIINEDSSIDFQECRFTSDGYPQLSSVTNSGIKTYNATIMTRKVVTNDEEYDDILATMWGLSDGNINKDSSLLDEGMLYASD